MVIYTIKNHTIIYGVSPHFSPHSICFSPCMYVCMHVCMCLCMHVCMCLDACMYVCLHVCVLVCMHTCMLVDVCIEHSWLLKYAWISLHGTTFSMISIEDRQTEPKSRVWSDAISHVALEFESRPLKWQWTLSTWHFYKHASLFVFLSLSLSLSLYISLFLFACLLKVFKGW